MGASEAQAQEGLGFRNWGLRGGVTIDPDQGHVGFHINAGLNLVAGFEAGRSNRYLLEIRAGVGGIPDFKVTVGINL